MCENRKIVDYCLVVFNNTTKIKECTETVVNRISEGWQPFGIPQLFQSGYLVQVMVKYEEHIDV